MENTNLFLEVNGKKTIFMSMESVRVDKWLWAVRIFKTRTASGRACDNGKVRLGESPAKSSSKVKVDDVVRVRLHHENRQFKVLKLIEKRVGAQVAMACYEDITPPEERIDRLKSAFALPTAYRERGTGRPTKKDRREIDEMDNQHKGMEDNHVDDFDWDDLDL